MANRRIQNEIRDFMKDPVHYVRGLKQLDDNKLECHFCVGLFVI